MIKRTLFFGNPTYLSTRNNQLVINFPSDKKGEIIVPIEDVGFVVLENPQITITHKLLSKLIENKSSIIICDERRMPFGYVQPFDANTLQSKRIRLQASLSKPLKDNLWQQTVIAKIKNQAAVLAENGRDHRKLLYWAKNVKTGDSQNHEAFSAAYYWSTLFEDKFERNRYGSPPNNLLNYGYAILRAVTARALTSTGLHPSLGIFHKNQYNAYALADDIMEPYRAYVDNLVYNIYKSGIEIDELTVEIKQKLLQIPVMDVMIRKRNSPLMNAMSQTTNSLYECMTREKRKVLFPSYES